MGKTLAVSLLTIGLLTFSIPLFAHHGAASYDVSKTIVLKGIVTDYVWSNPHVFVKVDVKDDSGNLQHWLIEAQNPRSQTNAGWSKNTFKPGDEVAVDAVAAKNGEPIGRFTGRIVINGQVFKP